MGQFTSDLAGARALDEADPLRTFRAEFAIPDPDLIYLDGNSLGRLPRRTMAVLQRVVEVEWGEQLIRSWGEGWFQASQAVGEKIARLVGAAPGQVIVSDSTSVNLYKLAMAALENRPGRKRIVSDVFNFPSDLYILQGCIRQHGSRHTLYLVPSRDGIHIDLQEMKAAIDADTALVVLSLVAFKSAFLYDAAEITAHAEKVGAQVIWDLSHAAGAVPVDLDGWGAHFAIGCSYKYLNGGPGAPAYLYVRRDLQSQALNPIWGWFGTQRQFAFDLDYCPAAGIERFLCGSPPILAMLALEPGLDLIHQAGMGRIRQKSILLTAYLIYLFDQFLAPLGFTLGSPRQPELRGSHVSIRHPAGYQINRALIEEMNLIPDFREPDNIRLGLAPMYTSFTEVWHAVQRVRRVVLEGRFQAYPAQRQAVT